MVVVAVVVVVVMMMVVVVVGVCAHEKEADKQIDKRPLVTF